MPNKLLTTLIALTLLIMPIDAFTANQTDSDKFVRTANYYLLSGSALDTPAARSTLHKYDLLVLPVEAQVYNRDFFAHARRMNPDIIILAYVVTDSWNEQYWNDSLHQQMLSGIQNDYWLGNGRGSNYTSNWPGLRVLNMNSGWSNYLANFTVNNVLSTGLWDGVFYDDVGEGISNIGSVDVDRNGSPDNSATADQLWRNGYVNLVARTRAGVGDRYHILTNGSSRRELSPYVNGRMFEAFPTPWEGFWTGSMQKYIAGEQSNRSPQINIINGTTDNTGNLLDFQKMRYGLTSTLLGGGYFGFDFGTTRHNDIWYYDEFDASIGAPIGGPVDRLNPGNTSMRPSVWERDFQAGKVLVNATNNSHRIVLNGDYEHLRGNEDPIVNNGRIVSSVTLKGKDGVILLRTIEEVYGASFINGSFIRVFDGNGVVERNGFFGFDSKARGSENVVRYDIDFDGKLETIVAGDSRVDIYEDDGSLKASFHPYTPAYNLGVNIAVGDIENDGTVEIVTGTERGGGPQMRIFNGDGNLIHPGFFAYDERFRGGVNIAIGDLNGDNINEIIAGAGVGGGPHVRVFNKDGRVINPGFFAYDEYFRGGVNVAVGDVNGDGIDDIITGPGRGGGPEVRVFDKDGNESIRFNAFDSGRRDGVEVTAADIDGDGLDEIMAMSTQIFF